jgi:hypothetical protein
MTFFSSISPMAGLLDLRYVDFFAFVGFTGHRERTSKVVMEKCYA